MPDIETIDTLAVQELPTDIDSMTRLANRLLQQMTALEAERRANIVNCEEEVKALEVRTQDLNRVLEGQIKGLALHLEAVSRNLIGDGTKRSRKLLHGEVALRKHGEAVIVEDIDALVKAILTTPGLAGTLMVQPPAPPPKLSKAALDSHVFATRSPLPGTKIEPEQDRFSYKLHGLD